MAQYHIKAAKLKPLVEQSNFTVEQLNLIHQMMRGCVMLRQGKVISSFLECMLPDGFELKEGRLIAGKYGSYRPVYVVKKGEEIPASVIQTSEEEEV